MNSGFSLHSLSKLESTKSYDGKTNLLDFVEKSLGDNVDFVASMGSVLKARQVNLGDMSKSVNDILSRLDRVGHLHLVNDNIDHLVRDAKRQLHDLLQVVDIPSLVSRTSWSTLVRLKMMMPSPQKNISLSWHHFSNLSHVFM